MLDTKYRVPVAQPMPPMSVKDAINMANALAWMADQSRKTPVLSAIRTPSQIKERLSTQAVTIPVRTAIRLCLEVGVLYVLKLVSYYDDSTKIWVRGCALLNAQRTYSDAGFALIAPPARPT